MWHKTVAISSNGFLRQSFLHERQRKLLHNACQTFHLIFMSYGIRRSYQNQHRRPTKKEERRRHCATLPGYHTHSSTQHVRRPTRGRPHACASLEFDPCGSCDSLQGKRSSQNAELDRLCQKLLRDKRLLSNEITCHARHEHTLARRDSQACRFGASQRRRVRNEWQGRAAQGFRRQVNRFSRLALIHGWRIVSSHPTGHVIRSGR